MNCKQGDLAVVVKAALPQNVGLIVKVVSLDPHWKEPIWILTEKIARTGVSLIDGSLTSGIDRCRDACLRPIRDSDGADETLSWASVPNKVSA